MRRLVVVVSVAVGLAVPAPPATAAPRIRTAVVQRGLSHPWDIAFAPDGRMLVTERAGRIKVFASRRRGAALLGTVRIPRVRAEGEAGAMGLAVRKHNGRVFVFVCASRQVNAGWRNQVLRYTLGGRGALRFDKIVLGRMRANTHHNGCAVEVGPDNRLWVAMGDAGNLSLPQSRRSRNGKILRVALNGAIPSDNPFRGSPVYAVGLRNPQGIAFYPGTRRAYAIEHGPDVHDEINRIRPGRNYGWPCWTGRRTRGPLRSGCGPASEYRAPAWSSGARTLATSNGAFIPGSTWGGWRNSLFVATLKEQDVRRFRFNDTGSRAEQRTVLFNGRWGRLRAAVASPDGRALLLTTSNGAGDRIIRVRAG